MQSINQKAERLRELLDGPDGIELPGCYDVLSAMILERAGFQAVFMSGYGVAASFLGNPDIGLTSLVETALLTQEHLARDRPARSSSTPTTATATRTTSCAPSTSSSTPARRR